MTAQFIAAEPAVPTEDEFLTLVRNNRMAEAVQALREAKARDPKVRLFTAPAMRTVCAFLRRDHGLPAQIAGFEMLLAEYPALGETHSRLAAAYADSGQPQKAVEHYQKSLDLLEADTTLPESAKAPARESMKQQIARLRPQSQ